MRDKWLYVFKNLHNLWDMPELLQEKVFSKLFKIAEIAKYSKAEQEAYEESLKSYRDLFGITETAHREGVEKGIEIGVEKGREEGIEIGVEKGREEALKKAEEEKEIRIVAQLKRGKLTEEEIAQDFEVLVAFIKQVKIKYFIL
jgi:flagellar biosynthesis/type III secretory pathway protein FliH